MADPIKPLEATNGPQPNFGDQQPSDGTNEAQVSAWSQLEVGDAYQRQLDQLRQLAV